MLTPDDLSAYKTKESLLSVIRSRRTQNNSGATGPGTALRGTVPINEVNNRGLEDSGRAASQPIYGTNGSVEDSQGSADGFTEQIGQQYRRSAGDYSGIYQSERAATTSAIPKHKPRLSLKLKDTYQKYKQALVEPDKKKPAKKIEGRKLTDAEAIKLRPKLVEYVLWQSEHLDQHIIATTVGHDPTIEVWSDLTEDEAEILVDFIIARGKTDVRTANAVRYVSTFIDKIKVVLIVTPRMYKMAMVYWTRGFSIK